MSRSLDGALVACWYFGIPLLPGHGWIPLSHSGPVDPGFLEPLQRLDTPLAQAKLIAWTGSSTYTATWVLGFSGRLDCEAEAFAHSGRNGGGPDRQSRLNNLEVFTYHCVEAASEGNSR